LQRGVIFRLQKTNSNIIKELLIKLGISDLDSIVDFFPFVRDRADVSVLKCKKSGVLFLSGSDHINFSHYEEMNSFSYWNVEDRERAVNQVLEDTNRRKALLNPIVTNKKWLDVGTGSGALLDQISKLTFKADAVEPQKEAQHFLKEVGYTVYSSLKEINKVEEYDIITLFHVFEHFLDPLGELEIINSLLKNNGRIIIEVPHANDFLISFLNFEPFKKFTFWSEHLILHTRESLRMFLEKSGFREITIKGCQRYPLVNHLYWLSKGKPGGHEFWNFIRTMELDSAYEKMLSSIDKNDTLIAFAKK
jgi:2-polyprenyl-3-methyl-5-hydroxy-6-metoxy-1,4-benzoquinol methylase